MNSPGPDFPDDQPAQPPACCRAREVGHDPGFAECLMGHDWKCKQALHFGYVRFCKHPLHKEIIAQTRKADESQAPGDK